MNAPSTPSRFAPVPLPTCPPGAVDADALVAAIEAWVTSEPVRALAAASGWPWPRGRGVREVVGALVTRSDDWDFRRRRERNLIEAGPARIAGRVVPEELVLGAATALGLVDAAMPARPFDHVVVLSGLLRACVNRVRFSAELLDGPVDAGSVVLLTAHRALGGDELTHAAALGLPDDDEANVVAEVARATWKLAAPASVERGSMPYGEDAGRNGDWSITRWEGSGRGPDVALVVAPSSDPGRRANTADQLRFWAEGAAVDERQQILVVTTQIYTPFQHLEAIRTLGLPRGIGVTTVGVDAAHASIATRAFAGVDYLQEVRSTLQAAERLLDDLGPRP